MSAVQEAYVMLNDGVIELPSMEEAEVWIDTYDAELCPQHIIDRLTYPVTDSLGHPMYAIPNPFEGRE